MPGLIAAGLGVLPWAAYDLWITQALPNFASWFAQNQTPTPPPWDIALSLGLPGLVAAISLVRWIAAPGKFSVKARSIPPETLLFGTWLCVNLALLYAPIPLQRRLMLGMWIPLAALAAPRIEAWLFQPAFSISRALVSGIALILTNILFLTAVLFSLGRHNPLLFLSRDEAAAVDWLEINAPGSVVLASPELSLWLPGMAGVRVVYGHPMETPYAEQARDAVERYFSGTECACMLKNLQVNYILYGPREQAFGGNPDKVEIGSTFSFGSVTIYKVP